MKYTIEIWCTYQQFTKYKSTSNFLCSSKMSLSYRKSVALSELCRELMTSRRFVFLLILYIALYTYIIKLSVCMWVICVFVCFLSVNSAPLRSITIRNHNHGEKRHQRVGVWLAWLHGAETADGEIVSYRIGLYTSNRTVEIKEEIRVKQQR